MEYYEFDKMDNERYLSCYENCMQLSSDLSPYSLLALRDEPVCARRAYDYGLCFHRGYFGGELCYGPPVGDWDAADWEEIFAKEFPSGSVFWGIPELLMKKWVRTFGDSLEVLESRDDNHLYGSVFRIDGKICGVLINEIIDESNVVGLYQKQDISYEGLSAYMLVSDCRYLYEQGYLIYNIMADIGSEDSEDRKQC